MKTSNLIQSIGRDVRDILGAVVSVLRGPGKDPKRFAKEPPEYWHKATPEADVPERKTTAAEVDLTLYTAEEILGMTESEYNNKIGVTGIETWEQARKQAEKIIQKRRQSNARQVNYTE